MRSDRPLIVSILFLATGLGLIIGYCHGTAGFSAAYPVAGASLQLSLTTNGPAAMGGFALTLVGLLLLIWALICAIVGQIQLIGSARDRDWLERPSLLGREERVERQERLRESHPKE